MKETTFEKNGGYFINGVPIKNTTNIDVNIARPVLTVRNLNTLNKENVSAKCKNKL